MSIRSSPRVQVPLIDTYFMLKLYRWGGWVRFCGWMGGWVLVDGWVGGFCEVVGPWHFDNGASSKIDDVLAKDGGILHGLPLAIHLHLFFDRQVGWTILTF